MAARPASVSVEALRAKTQAVEKVLKGPQDLSDKLLLQSELGFMRSMLGRGRPTVNVTYPVNPPHAFVQIVFNNEEGEFNYVVREPTLRDGEAELIETIKEKMEALEDRAGLPMAATGRLGDNPALRQYLQAKFARTVELYDLTVDPKRRPVIFYYLQRELVGLGKADAVLRDPFIEDVSCNGHGVPIYVFHRVFGSIKTNVVYPGELELNKYIMKLAQVSGKHVSIYQPILDATLQDGSRINLTLGTEVTRKGSTFSIRKFSADPISPIDLIRLGSLSAHQAAWFWHLIEFKRSILVSGGTASGKTTLLNALCMFIRPEDKIVSIEDTPEVHIAHSNWIQSVSRAGYGIGGSKAGENPGAITLFDLLVAALRQRPEYVLVGEVRGREASTLFQAIATGHAAMATIHAGSIEELVHRIENDPMKIPRVLLPALDVVAFPAQVVAGGGRARRVKGIVEILDVDNASGNLITNDVFGWDPKQDKQQFLGRSFALEKIAKATGKDIDAVHAEVERKTRFLDLLVKAGRSNFQDVTKAVNRYYVDPVGALAEAEARLVR